MYKIDINCLLSKNLYSIFTTWVQSPFNVNIAKKRR